ncbi:MAG: DMT family transporter [Deltaproteobacteria bacterium]|nr:DMT family transporter [Deltaproteobacteria bacterium]
MPMFGMPYIGEVLSVGAALFWAVGVVLFKKSGETMEPLALNLFKNAVAIVLLLPTIPLAGESFAPPDQPLEAWLLLAASGVIGIAIADTMFFISLEKLGAGLTAVVDTSYTPLMLFLSVFVLSEQIGIPVYLGAALILLGMLAGSRTKPEAGKSRKDLIFGILIGVGGIGLMAVSIVMIKRVLDNSPVLWATWVRLLAGTAVLIPMLLASPRRGALLKSMVTARAFKFPLAAAIVGTYLAMMCWIGGMKHVDVSVATTLNQLSTIFIFVLAVIFLKEALTWRRVLAIVLACSGGLLVALRRLLV